MQKKIQEVHNQKRKGDTEKTQLPPSSSDEVQDKYWEW